MNLHKSLAITFLLLGAISLVLGIGAILVAVALGSAAGQFAAMPGGAETAAGLQTMVAASWVFGILEFLLGVSALITSMLVFREKVEKKKR